MKIDPQQWPLFHRIFRVVVESLVPFFYRIRFYGQEHLPPSGGALLIGNHVSFLDGPIMMMSSRRPVRMVVHAANFRNKWFRKWGELWGAIYIDAGPKAMLRALQQARQALDEGYLVGMFPEGGISRTGQLQSFRAGMSKIVAGTGCPIIPVCLDGLWGSIYSFAGGKFFWKWPRKWRYPVQVTIGAPMSDQTPVQQIRQVMAEMTADAVPKRNRPYRSLPCSFVRMCRHRLFSSKVADSSDADNTGGQALLRTLILRRLLKRVLAPDEKNVGVLLPPSVGGMLANMALALDRRVPIHLNYTMQSAGINECIRAAQIRHVVTSRQVMSKLDLKLDVPIVYLEDFKSKVETSDKIAGAIGAFVLPAFLLNWLIGTTKIRGSDTATIVFTSGSTGTPKGVVLSYDNIASNVEAIDAVIRLKSSDVVLGILPFFHSFGYTVTLWTPMALDMKAIYHFSPLDARRIGQLVQKHQGTILLSTPTFLRSYLNRCTPEQFKSLDVVVAGAEKLPKALTDAFEARFGVRPVEGYGCTELSPFVSVNIPPSRSSSKFHIERREGSVGMPIPNVAARIRDRESSAILPCNQAGLLEIKGPNVMQGYLNDPRKTAEVIHDGWYNTGDVAFLDDDGFIHITGRESRFSKIGGEMVPHILIEEALTEILAAPEEAGVPFVVTAVPDEKKGERLIVLHRPMAMAPQELCDALLARNLPNLFIPSVDSFVEIDQMPTLGTGKIDLKAAREIALERTEKSAAKQSRQEA